MRIKDFLERSNSTRRQRTGELLRFGVVGITATVLQYAVYRAALCRLDHNLAMTIGYVVSFIFNFFASTRYTFRVDETTGRGLGFALSHVVNYLLQMATLNLFIGVGLSKSLAPVPMFAVCVPINFVLVRFFLKQNGIRIFSIFKIAKAERRVAGAALALMAGLNTLLLCRYALVFTPLQDNYRTFFIKYFHLSGFDPLTYAVVSNWAAEYNVYRHPLLAFFMYVPYLLNQALIALTGVNCTVFVIAALLVFCSFYSFVFFYRILRQIIGLDARDAALLSFFFFSFAYVMLSVMAPDHFILSLFMLLLTLYITGMRMQQNKPLPIVHTLALFILTAGISLNNGLKVFIAALWANGRRFFRPRYLLFAILLPAALLWQFSRFEYKQLVWPDEMARHEARAKQRAEQQKKNNEKAMQVNPTAVTTEHNSQQHHSAPSATPPKPSKMGTPMMQGEFMRWTDISTSRMQSVIENLFGESIQLHQDHRLEDVFGPRPVIVPYRWVVNYVVEGLIVLLFLAGIVCGRRSRFLWMALSFALTDMVLHVGLGFGLNEIYIMSAHWIYVIPLAMAYLFTSLRARSLRLLRTLVVLLTLYLYIYNVWGIVSFLTEI